MAIEVRPSAMVEAAAEDVGMSSARSRNVTRLVQGYSIPRIPHRPAAIGVAIVAAAFFAAVAWAADTEQQKLTASDGNAGDFFGNMALDGGTAIIGAVLSDDAGANSGSAYVFRFDGSDWTEQQKLTASDGAAGDFFGGVLALDGATAMVTASGDDDRGENSGSVYVFRFDGSDWTEQQKLTASDGDALDCFGCSVAISGDTAVMGAANDEAAGAFAGSAYIFRFDGSTWVEEAKVTASDASANAFFGVAAAISDDVAVIGALDDFNAGSVYVFRFDGTHWIEEAKLTASDRATNDNFGNAIAISGETLVVGAWGDEFFVGSAYVFRFDGSSWVEERNSALATAPHSTTSAPRSP